MYYIYVLQSLKDLKTYTGFSDNVERRITQHNSGQVKSTKHRKPFKLLFTEEFQTINEAKDREKWWKSSKGRKKMKEYFNNKNKE